MAKQLNVNLGFTADTSRAKAAINELTTSLNQIGSGAAIGKDLPITNEIREAQMAAQQLSASLTEAFNVNTGKLDLNKFNSSLRASGMSLSDYGNKLSALGATGDQAFLKVAQSIVTTEAPLRRSSTLLTGFMTTLKNTARWQISSSILHGFMGAVQSAYGYAQDLDKSLNNIRIVTGQNADQMAEFAKQANKAAKALSTTTTEYTDAALIYYQQGLNDEQVLDRTNVTVKMANVAGETAEVVSDQLTAVWNNFYEEGGKSLEYYADVMTALGAATASSTDEIAEGLEKFASVADTVGLSYEYATSALATVTATTRQSADVVGTAFKTLFARIQDLELGKTLDDGTTLGTYSEALMKVGINIKDTNGEMKDMDAILEEMGAKWKTINKDQQVALAQQVAGVRQYTQLVALMDNWDYFQENLGVAEGAEGELSRQAEIYEESWQASSDRVRASMESIYGALLDEEFFISLNDGLAQVADTVKMFIDSLGGIKGVLAGLGLIITSVFKNQLTDGINNALHNFKNFTGVSKQEMIDLQNEAMKYAEKMTIGLSSEHPETKAQIDHLKRTHEMQERLRISTKGMTEEQIKNAQNIYKTATAYSEMALEAGKAAEAAQQLRESQKREATNTYGVRAQNRMQESSDLSVGLTGNELLRESRSMLGNASQMGVTKDTDAYQAVVTAMSNYRQRLEEVNGDVSRATIESNALRDAMANLSGETNAISGAFVSYLTQLEGIAPNVVNAKNNFEQLQITLSTTTPTDDQVQEMDDLIKAVEEAGLPVQKLTQLWNNYKAALKSGDANKIKEASAAFNNFKITQEEVTDAVQRQAYANTENKEALAGMGEELKKQAGQSVDAAMSQDRFTRTTEQANAEILKLRAELEAGGLAYKSFGSAITGTLRGLSSFAMGLQSLSSIKDTLNNNDLSSWEKTLQIMMSLGMAIPMVTSGFTSLSNAYKFATSASMEGLTANLARLTGIKLEGKAISEHIVLENGSTIAKTESAMAANAEAIAEGKATVVTKVHTKAIWGEIAAQAIKHWYIAVIIVAIGVLIGLIYQMVKAYNADAEALERANVALENSTEAYNKASDAVENFKDKLSNYQDALKGLKELEEGSQELADAVEEANKKANELIETYGLYGQYSFGENGEIIIDQDALDNAQKELEQFEKRAGMLKYSAEINQDQAELDNTATNLGREITYYQRGGVYKDAEGNPQVILDYQTGMKATKEQMYSLAEATKKAQEANGGASLSLDELKQAIKDNSAEWGISQTVIDNLNSFINDETIDSLTDLASSMDKAAEAALYYARQILGLSTEDVYGETLKGLAMQSDGTVDENLYNLLTQATTSVLANNQSNIDEYIKGQQEKVSSDITDNVSDWDAGDVTEDNVKNYLNELFGDTKGFTSGDQWIKDNYKEIFGTSLNYDSDINAQEMAQAYYESLGYTITSVKDKNGQTVLSGMDSEGNTVEDMKIDNEQAQIQWANMITNYAIEQMAKQKSLEALSTEDVDSIYSSILNANDSYGADWSTAFLTGLANPNLDKEGFDFSSLYGQLNESEIDELKSMSGEDLAAMLGLTPEQIEQLGLGSAETFAESFRKGLEGWTQEAYEQGADAAGDQRAATLDLDPEVFKSYRDQLAATNEELANERDLLNEVAIVQMRTDRAMQSLADNWEDWNNVMTDSESTIGDVAELMPDLRSMMEDLLDWDAEDVKLLPEDFYKDNWDVIQDVYNGVDGAVEKLQGLATKEYIIKLGLEEDLNGDALTAYNNVLTMLESVPDLEIGMTLDDAGMYDALQALLDAGIVTVDQMNTILENIGFDPLIETKKIDLDQFQASEDGNTYTVEYLDTEGNVQTKTITAQTYHDAEAVGFVEFPVINNSKTKYSGAGGVNVKPPKSRGSGGGGGGGKSAKPEKVDKTKKSDVVERYKEINDQLDDIQDKMDDASKAADRLYGPARLKEMDKINKALKTEIGLLKQKTADAKNYLEQDRAALQKAAHEAGLGDFTFDDNNISNYEEQMSRLYNQLAAAEAKADPKNFSTKEAQDEYIKNNVTPIQERIEAVKDAISQYDETRELIQDLDNELQDAINAWQDNNYEKLTYKLELKLNISEVELEELDYYLNKISDDFYQMAEAAATMRTQMYVSDDIITAQKDHVIELEKAYNTIDEKTGERLISQAAYIEGLKESRSAMYAELETLLDLDKSMQEHYGNTVDMANEELATYTDRMEHLTSVLDHYQNLLELTGRQKDYDNMGKVLRGRAQTIEDQAKVSKATYEMFANQAKELKAEMEAAEGTDNYDFIREQWLAAQEAAEEAQDQMLSDAAEWAEAMKAAIENELAGLADVLENALTAEFGSFDYMAQKMERAESLQEEYLTTTNKIYETTKLMRTAQNAIDTTTNTVAKQRLKNFINETAELQNQTKLSEYELEIQQAKYDLLLAEIALEEAQQAKSTVRLQRDSEGNFGYVYTADQDKVAQAQQELEDAQNSLYNIALEGANSYTQKYQEALAAMYDELTELQEQWLNGEITTQQEYNEKMQAIQDHYYETLKNYSSLYQVAITTDSRVVADAWSSDFADMTLETDKWMNAVNDYVDECEDKFIEWQKVIQDVETCAGVDLDNLAGAVKGITDESKALEQTLTDPKNGVIKGLNDELNSVRTVTEAYLAQRTAILETVAALERYLTALGQKIAAESQAASEDSDNDSKNSTSGNTSGGNTSSGKSGSAKSQAADIIRGVHSGSIPVTSSGWGTSAANQGYSSEAIALARQALNDSKPGGGYSYDYNKALQLVGYDTGGYTGQWGPEGKLALLHEKEIVLNAKDTENLLASMDILHNIIDVIDMQAMSAQMGGLLRSPSLMQSDADVLEQHVTIEANFPAVTSRIEIEEAFDNLINKASQYANRK